MNARAAVRSSSAADHQNHDDQSAMSASPWSLVLEAPALNSARDPGVRWCAVFVDSVVRFERRGRASSRTVGAVYAISIDVCSPPK